MDTLVIDVGNTRIHWRMRRRGEELCEDHATLETMQTCISEWSGESGKPLRIAISCLRPGHRTALEKVLHELTALPILWIENGSAEEVSVETDYPEKTGADRALAALAWGGLHGRTPAVIIDAGTAVTVDAVSPEGILLGGWIAPGWEALRSSLSAAAPELPCGGTEVDSMPWALETSHALCGGFEAYFHAGIVDLHSRVQAGLQTDTYLEIATVLTGGDAHRLQADFPAALVIPGLVLDGLELALERVGSEQRAD